MDINWYPGHMAKTRRKLSEQIGQVDLVIELCDARLPFSSRNPDLDLLIGSKSRILFLNKADLADPKITNSWLHYFKKEGLNASALQANQLKPKITIAAIEKTVQNAIDHAALKGVRKTIRAMVVGVPNVGKSTYINHLRGASIAMTGDRPGVTRSNQWVKITPYLELLDTPGLLWPRLSDQVSARRLCYLGTIRDDILDLDELTMSLLNDLSESCPDSLENRFHVNDHTLRDLPLLNAVCQGRGFLRRGNEPDYERCYHVVLDEFRSGKLGRITLERPERTYADHGQS